MSPLPSGTVTFLYTDIEGSTRLWELHRESMPDVLKRNDEIWRTAVAANNGQIYRITGDGYCAAFSNAAQALNSAAAAQLALYEEEWGAIEQLRVRAIVHTGSAVVNDADYVGGSLNMAGRLLSVCHGGQILVCPPCAAVRGYQEEDLIEGAVLAGSAAMLAVAAEGAITLTF